MLAWQNVVLVAILHVAKLNSGVMLISTLVYNSCKVVHAPSASCHHDEQKHVTLKLAQNADNSLKPLIEELALFPNKSSYRSVGACDLELNLSHENKGIESIQFYDDGAQGMLLPHFGKFDVCFKPVILLAT